MKSTFEYYQNLKSDKRINIVKYEGLFNYSKINNYARKFANGKYLLFLNNTLSYSFLIN